MSKRDRTIGHETGELERNLDIDLRSLETFLRVVETGGMTAAARSLGISQSAVSQSISNLETGLGVQLLDRTVRPVVPTLSGSLLVEQGSALVRAAQQTVRRVRSPLDLKIPHLRLAMPDSVAATVGPHLIPILRNEVAKCSIFSGLSTSHRDLLANHQADIVLSVDPFDDMPGLYRQEIFTEPYVMIVPASYPEHVDAIDKLSALGPLIRFSARSYTGQQIERHLRRLRLNIPQLFEFDTADTAFAMVSTGVGWAITTPFCLLQAPHRLRNTRFLPMPKSSFSRTVTLLCRDGEFTAIAARVAAGCRRIVHSACLAELGKIASWLEDTIRVVEG